MEKLGVENEELLNELRGKYTELLAKKNALVKEGSVDAADKLDREIEAVRKKLSDMSAEG
jgi:hypothetical protein